MEFASYLYVSEQVPSGTPKNHQFHENPPIFTHFHGIPLNLVESHENGEKLVISTIFRSTAVPAVPAAPAVPAVPAVRHGPLGLMGALGALGLLGLQGLLVVQRRSAAVLQRCSAAARQRGGRGSGVALQRQRYCAVTLRRCGIERCGAAALQHCSAAALHYQQSLQSLQC